MKLVNLPVVGFLLLGVLHTGCREAVELPAGGVVVEEEPERGSALEEAGLRPGDLVVSWERLAHPPANPRGDRGRIESPFDWLWLEMEELPRGTVRLHGERDGEPRVWTVNPGVLTIRIRPVMPANRQTQGWLRMHAGETLAEEERWDEAGAAFRDALQLAQGPRAKAFTWDALGKARQRERDWEEARQAYQSALDTRRETWGETLGVAKSLNDLGAIAGHQKRFQEQEDHRRAALALYRRQVPESAHVGRMLTNLGFGARSRGDLDAAAALYRQALDVYRKTEPDGLRMARCLNHLGFVVFEQGDLGAAERLFQQSVAIYDERAPDSPDLARFYNNLGIVAHRRGDLDVAEQQYRRSLDIRRKTGADPYNPYRTAQTLNNLGLLNALRGDFEGAQALYQRAIDIYTDLASQDLAMANVLNNWGLIEIERHDLEAAEEVIRRALAIFEGHGAVGADMASTLRNLGDVAERRGHLDDAEELYGRSLAICREKTPGSVLLATILKDLGDVAAARGRRDVAERRYLEALALLRTVAPEKDSVASVLHALGELWRDRRPRQAADHFRQAIDVLEAQIAHLGGSYEARGGYRSWNRSLYQDTVDVLLELGRFEEAFHVLERSRTRGLLEMLAERDLVLDATLSGELETERRELASRWDQVLLRIAMLTSAEADDLAALRAELRQLRRERGELFSRIRATAPRLADLRYPEPLEVAEAREALDPGTVLLSFNLGAERTDLFVLDAENGLEVRSSALGEADLRRRVEVLRELIETPPWPRRRARFLELGRELHAMLIEPVEPFLDRGERLVILPDGPLHLLPFAALPRPDGRYLVEWKPLHVTLSATFYAELRKSRRPAAGSAGGTDVLLVAFGDPRYPDWLGNGDVVDRAEPRLRGAVRQGLFTWDPLSHTRREVLGIADLYPPGSARVHLAGDATEERAKAVGREARILHFAAHAYLDSHLPLNSAVALTIPADPAGVGDNGLLQVWEIFEELRLDADLVVLSACATALGPEEAGEGLIGLTRAFHYAGARSVAATLWNVADPTAADLMVRFHRHLRAGKPKDEALRSAQLELIRQGELDASAPYHWAAFQLFGDWR